MSDRPQRPALDRHGPYRFMGTAYRRADPGAPRRPRTGGTLSSTEDVVLEAVKLGYKIADEQIAKGQDFARRLRGAAARSDASDVGDVVDQGMRLAKQVAILFMELAETTTQPQSVLRSVLRSEMDRGRREKPQADADEEARERAPAAKAKPTAAPYSVPVEVSSDRPTRVSLKLYGRPPRLPIVYPLYREGGGSTLAQVEFSTDKAGGYVLSVVVGSADNGTYRGYAIDPNDQEPLGVIEVVVSPWKETSPKS